MHIIEYLIRHSVETDHLRSESFYIAGIYYLHRIANIDHLLTFNAANTEAKP